MERGSRTPTRAGKGRAQPRGGWAASAAGDPRQQHPPPGPSLPTAALPVGAPAREKPRQRLGVGTLPRGPPPRDESDPRAGEGGTASGRMLGPTIPTARGICVVL